jgi:hypothetical protein
MPAQEHRRRPRNPLTGKVKVYWKGDQGLSYQQISRCLDISPAGARLESNRPIPLRAMIRLESPDFHIAGLATVRHCNRRGMQYVVGVEFSGGLEWRGPELD